MIPQIKFIVTGDIRTGRRFIGVGRSQFAREMLDKKKLKQWYGKPRLFGPAAIRCTKNYNLWTVHIHVPGGVGKLERYRRECFCNTCFAMGFVTAIDTETTDCPLYTVEICQESTPSHVYVEYQNVRSSSYARYEVEQPVIVGLIDVDAENYCCGETNYNMCGAGSGHYVMIIPVHDSSMARWLREGIRY